jgi:hypothetical protein
MNAVIERKRACRKPGPKAEFTTQPIRFTFCVEERHRDAILELGGGKWVREVVAKALAEAGRDGQ